MSLTSDQIVNCLITVPSTDGNFICHLGYASAEQLKEAISIMESNGGKNKSRIAACRRELRKRGELK